MVNYEYKNGGNNLMKNTNKNAVVLDIVIIFFILLSNFIYILVLKQLHEPIIYQDDIIYILHFFIMIFAHKALIKGKAYSLWLYLIIFSYGLIYLSQKFMNYHYLFYLMEIGSSSNIFIKTELQLLIMLLCSPIYYLHFIFCGKIIKY